MIHPRRHVLPGLLGLSALSVVAVPTLWGAAPHPTRSSDGQRSLDVAEALSDAFSNVADTIAPSVVSIRATDEVTFRSPSMMFPQMPDEFRRFFGDNPLSPFGQPNGQPRRQYRQGLGSGFVYSDAGYIITNNHVVDGADEITVVFSDGREYSAALVGADPQTDIAVIRVDASDLTPLTMADSDALRVGQWVVAAGSPFGLTSTITTGVVSATGRQSVGINDYEDFIQTDAAINPGNSGGPLVDLHGRVIGVNSAIASRSGGNNGVGFAIPVNLVKTIADTLISEGHVTRGMIGVRIQDLTPDLAGSFGFTGVQGAVVAEVMPDSPAMEAGFEPGDIITAVNGDPVHSASDLRLLVAEYEPGVTIQVRVFRDGKTLTLRPSIATAEDNSPVADAAASSSLSQTLGAQFTTLTPDLARRMNLPVTVTGVLVKSVEPMSVAARAGLRPGDIITTVNGEPADSAADLRTTLKPDRLREGVRLTVTTASGTRFVFLKINA